MAGKTLMMSFRITPCVREALEAASARDHRNLSNFIEHAIIAALPKDLQKNVMATLEARARRNPVSPQSSSRDSYSSDSMPSSQS